MNKSEAFNGFARWVLFGGEGMIAENRREEQSKIIKFNHLIANCVILYNVFVVTKELQQLAQEGREFDEQSPPLAYDLSIPMKKRQEQSLGIVLIYQERSNLDRR